MELRLQCVEQSGGCQRESRVSVERGKVTSATPSFEWAIGQGLHVVLSWCATRKIKWQRVRQRHLTQSELFK